MTNPAANANLRNRAALDFGLFGGGVAWLAHLLLCYGIGEFGCTSRFRELQALGITGIAWSLIGVSVVTFLIAAASTMVAHRTLERLRATARGSRVGDGGGADDGEAMSNSDARTYAARAGRILGAWFSLIIAVESLPILYYLHRC